MIKTVNCKFVSPSFTKFGGKKVIGNTSKVVAIN